MRYLLLLLIVTLFGLSAPAHARSITLKSQYLTFKVAQNFRKEVIRAQLAGERYDTVIVEGCSPAYLVAMLFIPLPCGGYTDGAFLAAYTIHGFGLKTIAKHHIISAGAVPFLAGRSPTVAKHSSVTLHGAGNWFTKNRTYALHECRYKAGFSHSKCTWLLTAGKGRPNRGYLKLTPENTRAAGFNIYWQ